jgi:IS30 family transposase
VIRDYGSVLHFEQDLLTTQVHSVFIDPGSPWQNAWMESFNGPLPRRVPIGI